jgi:hypothetical protein
MGMEVGFGFGFGFWEREREEVGGGMELNTFHTKNRGEYIL